jgi:3(or 17)beta-hydroxysteroid dehydrogenase
MDRLKDKIALITGGSKGLGEADARAFIAEGATVILADIDDRTGEALAEELGPRASYVHLDVRDEAAWIAVIGGITDRFGGLDVLVNNAGVFDLGTPETITAESLHFIMAVSVDGMVFGCKHAIPAMKRRGGGSIINMSSLCSVQGEYLVSAYCAAKGAVESYTRAVAVYAAQARLGIRCNSVHPATIDTPMVRSIGEKFATLGPDKAMPELPPTGSSLNTSGKPEDVAHLLVYLASDESRFMSGQRFVVDNTSSVTTGIVPGTVGAW